SWLVTFTIWLGCDQTWQLKQPRALKIGRMSLANDTLLAKPCTRISGQPGPTAIAHEICPPTVGTNCTPTGSVPPGSNVEGPPPATTVKSPQVGTTFRISGAVPGLEIVKPSCLVPPTVLVPKSSVVSLNTHCAPAACSAPSPFRSTGGISAPRRSWHGDWPIAVGE